MGVSDKHVCDECPANMYPPIWMLKQVSDLTLEDAMEAYDDGFDFVCEDGKVSFIYNTSFGISIYKQYSVDNLNISYLGRG
jgi:hypothetical protein